MGAEPGSDLLLLLVNRKQQPAIQHLHSMQGPHKVRAKQAGIIEVIHTTLRIQKMKYSKSISERNQSLKDLCTSLLALSIAKQLHYFFHQSIQSLL